MKTLFKENHSLWMPDGVHWGTTGGENLMHQGLRRNHFLKSDIFPTPSDSSISQEPIHVLVSFERKRLP